MQGHQVCKVVRMLNRFVIFCVLIVFPACSATTNSQPVGLKPLEISICDGESLRDISPTRKIRITGWIKLQFPELRDESCPGDLLSLAPRALDLDRNADYHKLLEETHYQRNKAVEADFEGYLTTSDQGVLMLKIERIIEPRSISIR